jgi:hypothetical protein
LSRTGLGLVALVLLDEVAASQYLIAQMTNTPNTHTINRLAALMVLRAGLMTIDAVATRAGVNHSTAWRWSSAELLDVPARVEDARDKAWSRAVSMARNILMKEQKMPTFRGYGGGRPKRKGQLNLAPLDRNEPIPLRVTCRSCGHKDVVDVVAKDYYAVGFKLKATCAGCGKPGR